LLKPAGKTYDGIHGIQIFTTFKIKKQQDIPVL
jgi:hypothetical protein